MADTLRHQRHDAADSRGTLFWFFSPGKQRKKQYAMQLIANFKNNSGWQDLEWRSFLTRWLAIELVLIIIAAWFSFSYFHADEFYQTISFASYKLGQTPVEALAWEFGAKIRPWLQPGFYFLLAKILNFFGLTNPFLLAFYLRLSAGIFSLLAIAGLWCCCYIWIDQEKVRKQAVKFTALFCLVPYFAVRTSSETFSASLLTLAIVSLSLGRNPEERNLYKTALFLSGVFSGLTFQARYQCAFAVLGIALWLLYICRQEWKKIVLNLTLFTGGFLLILIPGTMIDFWGYKEITWIPWNYFNFNIIKGIAAKFGTQPFWAYLYMPHLQPMLPVTLYIMICLFIFWFRFPTHLLVWATIPFLLGHSVVSHKEVRFLLPMLYIFLLMPFLAFAAKGAALNKTLMKLKEVPYTLFGKIFLVVNFLCMAVLIFIFNTQELRAARFLYKNHQPGMTYYFYTSSPFSPRNLPAVFFYRPAGYRENRIETIEDFLQKTNANCYLITDRLLPQEETNKLAEASDCVYSDLPDFIYAKFNFNNWISRTSLYRIYRMRGPS